MDMYDWINRSKITVGEFVIDFPQSKLIRDDKAAKLEPLAMELLCYLISRRGKYVNKRDLLINVWNGRYVSDNAIRRVIKKIRDALGDDPKAPSYIKTVPSKGYLLIAQVQIQDKVDESAIQAGPMPSTPSWRLGLWAFAMVLLVAAGIYVRV